MKIALLEFITIEGGRFKVMLPLLVAGALLGVLIRLLNPQTATGDLTMVSHNLSKVSEQVLSTPAVASKQSANHDAPDLLVLVNNVALDMPMLKTMQALDALLQEQLRQPLTPESTQQALERMINLELVWQAAQQQNYRLPAGLLEQQMEAIQQRIATDNPSAATSFATLLTNAGFDLLQFQAYLTKLLVADLFANQQASALQIEPAAFVQSLHSKARISYGPAASMLISTATNEAPTATATVAAEPTVATPSSMSLNPESSTSLNSQPFSLVNLTPQPMVTHTTDFVQPSGAPTTAIETFPSGFISPTIATIAETDGVSETLDHIQSTEEAGDNYGLAIGDLPPRFSLPVHGSDQTTLDLEQLTGRPTVLSFWVSWCPYCQRQTPVLVAAAQTAMTQGVQFIGINVQEAPATISEYVKTNAIPYPILSDTNGQVAQAYAVTGYPVTYFLDRHGRISAQHIGALTAEQLESYLQSLQE